MRKIEEIKADIEKCDMCDWPDCTVKGGRTEHEFGCCPSCEAIYRGNKADCVNELIHSLTDGIPLSGLESICTAYRDGRYVILPCKVGDTVYVTKWAQRTDENGVVWDILDRKQATIVEKKFTLAMYCFGTLNETYWLTRESAEAAQEGGEKHV